MDLEVESQEEAFETNLIDHIDSERHLVINSGLDVVTEKRNDVGMDSVFQKEANDLMGKVFDTPNDAYDFYNRYAFLNGFGIRIHTTFKNKATNEHYQKNYVCNKEGFKDLKCKSSIGDVKKRRRDLRTGCKACLRISKGKDGKWLVDMFKDSHNHELTFTPTKVMKHRSHGKFHRSLTCKSLMAELGQSGLKPCQIKKVVNTMKSPLENDVTSKQCSDILADQRKQYKGKEFYGLIKHFQDKLIEDRNLYFVVDLFDDGSPRNIFWADGRSRDSYIKFGDVVVFDVTYMTNKFMMPFAPFVGVNHHGQSILFGGALLENEKQARDSPSEIRKLNTILLKFLEEQSIRTKSKQSETASQDSNVGSLQVNMMPQISIRDPLVHTNTKGRPKSATRIKSSLEAPKKRTCSYCKELGHYISGCPKKKAKESLLEKEG